MSQPYNPYDPESGQGSNPGNGDQYGQPQQPGQPYGSQYGQQGQPFGGQSGYDNQGGQYSQQGFAQQGGYTGYAGQQNQPLPGNQIDAVDSFSQGAKALFSNFLPWVLSLLVFIAVIVVLMVLMVVPVAVTASANPDGSPAVNTVTVLVMILAYGVMIIGSFLWALNMYRNAVRQVRGETVTFMDFFQFRGLLPALGMYILMSIIIGIGLILLVIPGLVAAFFLSYALFLIFARPELGVMGAFKESVEIAKRNPGPTILLIIFAFLLNAAGSLVVIGVLVTTPLAACMMAHAALKGSGEQVRRWA